MVLTRVLTLLCVAAAVVRSEEMGVGVSAELVSSPLRKLMQNVVKIHVMVHGKEVAPATEHEHYKKEEEEKKGAPRSSEAGEKHGKVHHEKNSAKQTQDDETVVEYKHGSVKIFGKKDSVAVDNEAERKAGIAEKVVMEKEQKVPSTANEVHEVATKLSSTSSADKKSFHDTFGPMVIICGVIGGLAAIIGVVGLVIDRSQSNKDIPDPDDSTELDVDVDIEANIVPVGAQDVDSDSDSSNDKDEEEGSFANRSTRVSM
ncbi:hypothetical protein DD237_000483 [Peronospora effusa]|uniref:RxLR effector candidate protein n=1 Tax=Peronospora effusa TaxID=542832 RepID=A0A3R7WIR8_9STRA|nr:hypothetical protein DD237_000483 [Peronospora effusa]